MIDTKEKILETAERLFAEQGYAATSLRQIITEAAVNLAAIHYHFGSKEDLLDELVRRKIGPINEERLAILDRLEAEAAGAPLPVDRILEAFLLPAAARVADRPESVRLIGRLYGEGMMPRMAEKHFKALGMRFISALRRAVPDIPEPEFMWRFEFMIGAMAHSMTGQITPLLGAPSGDWRSRLASLISFLSGGFRAPAVTDISVEEVTK